MMNKILGLLLLSVFFVACGDDEDPKTEYTLKDAECKLTHNLGLASAGSTPVTPATTKSLDEMLSNYDYNPPITSGVMSLTDGTSIEIEGLTSTLYLEDFILDINGIKKEFGKITVDDSQLYNANSLEFFKNVFNSMLSKKSLVVKASYKPSADLEKNDQVKVNIVLKGNFKYYK